MQEQRKWPFSVPPSVAPRPAAIGIADSSSGKRFSPASLNQSKVPPALQPPAGQDRLLSTQGKGDQVYECKTSDGGYKWVLKAPDARLFDLSHRLAGRHFAGPTWQSADGSSVTAKLTATVNSPDPRSIPWLLLSATGHSGAGVMASVASIQRLDTKGGKAPKAGCDASRAGTEIRVPYTADYYFYEHRR